jgi:hypothetical protein
MSISLSYLVTFLFLWIFPLCNVLNEYGCERSAPLPPNKLLYRRMFSRAQKTNLKNLTLTVFDIRMDPPTWKKKFSLVTYLRILKLSFYADSFVTHE